MLKLVRWASDHRRLVVVVWVVALIAATGISRAVGSHYAESFTLPGTDSQRAIDLLSSHFPAQSGDSDQIVFHSTSGKLTAPETRAKIDAVLSKVARLPHVTSVNSPFSSGGSALSKDATVGFATVGFDEAANKIPVAATDRVVSTASALRSGALQVEFSGDAIEQSNGPSIGYTALVGIGAAIVVLLISFGSMLAMGLPMITALLGLGTGLGLIALASRVFSMPDFASQLALMIGLGVGIDYALFIVTRYREAYSANGGDVRAAVAEAMNTAGRAVIFAGITVVIALLGMFTLGVSILSGIAIAASIAVLMVLAASLTLLPALLVFFGARIGRPGRRARRRSSPKPPETTFWARWVGVIQRRPWFAAIAATSLMLVLAVPALSLRLGNADASNDQHSQTTYKAYELLSQGFGQGFSGPLLVAIKLPATHREEALASLASALRATPDVAAVGPPRFSPDGSVATIAAYPDSSPQSSQTAELVRHLRSSVIPPVAAATGMTAYIGGVTAAEIDFSHVLSSKLWLFIGIVVLLSALLLMIVFRSLLIPVQAAVMNLLSIGAAMGIVVAVFQWGWFGSSLGINPGPIAAFIPVMVFAIVFGLSMDYEVFLVSRIHEEWVHGADSSTAVRHGLTRTGRVITAAAAVMIAVFASFMLGGERVLELFGLALASAVFVDAFIIRCILLPAVLELLGARTWWFPAGFDRRLPRLTIEPPSEATLPRSPQPVTEAS
jgi:RND superfamily putative drug exporter